MLCVLLACAPQLAQAHAVLLSTDPADGTRLERAPSAVVLRFNEPVTTIAVRVVDRDAAAVSGAVTAENETIRVALPANLPPGRYIISYRVMSADSHPVAGAVLFTIGDVVSVPANMPPAMAVDSTLGWTVAYGIARGIFYLGLLLTVGGFLFRRLVARGQPALMPARAMAASAIAAIVAAFVGVGLKGAQLAAVAFAGLFDLATWRLGVSTTLGPSALVAIVGFALILAASRAGAPGWLRKAGWIGIVLACASVAMTGHAATAAPRWLTAPAVAVHVLAAAFWIGALLPLRRAVALPAAEAAAVLQRFSRLALVAVALLLMAGGTLVIVQVETVSGALETDYGWILIYKLLFVVTLLAVAALNKFRWTPGLARGDAHAKTVLTKLLNLDLGLALAVIVATAALGQVPPPRALHAYDAHDAHGHHDARETRAILLASPMDEGRFALLEVTPARAGRNRLTVTILDEAGQRVRPLEIKLELSLPSSDIGPLSRVLVATPDGRFTLEDDALSLWGRWTVEAHVLLTEFKKSIVSFDVFVN